MLHLVLTTKTSAAEPGELGAAEQSKAELPNGLQPSSSEQAVPDDKAESTGDNAAHV